MNRRCSTAGCLNQARPQRRLCNACRTRDYRARYGSSTWRTADDLDVAAVVSAPRPAGELTRLERLLIAERLSERQMPATEIAAVVGVSPRTVVRWRTRRPKTAA